MLVLGIFLNLLVVNFSESKPLLEIWRLFSPTRERQVLPSDTHTCNLLLQCLGPLGTPGLRQASGESQVLSVEPTPLARKICIMSREGGYRRACCFLCGPMTFQYASPTTPSGIIITSIHTACSVPHHFYLSDSQSHWRVCRNLNSTLNSSLDNTECSFPPQNVCMAYLLLWFSFIFICTFPILPSKLYIFQVSDAL